MTFIPMNATYLAAMFAANQVVNVLLVLLSIVAVVAIMIVIANIHIVPQGRAYVVERLGTYLCTWETGFHVKRPFFDRIAKKINLMEQVVDFPPQPVITKDNVRMQIDTVVFYQITDCKLFAYGHATPMTAIENLTSTTLRNIIGEMELDNTLTSRDIINTQMRAVLDEATDPWGIKVTRVELKNIIPPREIQDAMEKQMKAERERRESILRAEGEKKSAILVAEGQKEAAILRAQAEKEAAILRAEADKQAEILRAEAAREARIREAEGEAEAIRQVQEATAAGIRMVNDSQPTDAVLTIKSLEALEKVANGQATKLIIPSNIQGIAGLAASLKEIATMETTTDTQN